MTPISKKLFVACLFFSLFAVVGCGKKDITAPVQFDYKETVGCLVTNDWYAIHFSAYIKPDGDLKNISGKDRKKLLRSYCKEIPRSGSLYFTADLADDDARELPIGVRLVKQELIGEDNKKAENFRDIATLIEIPAKLYPRGMVETQVDLSEEGYYALYLMIGEEGTVTDENILRIPMNVGVDPDVVSTWQRVFTILSILLGIVIPCGIGLIILSPILPVQRWANSMNRFFFMFRYKQGINNADK